MPVEIKELVIRAVVDPEPSTGTPTSAVETGEDVQQRLVEECVRQVLKILRESADR